MMAIQVAAIAAVLFVQVGGPWWAVVLDHYARLAYGLPLSSRIVGRPGLAAILESLALCARLHSRKSIDLRRSTMPHRTSL